MQRINKGLDANTDYLEKVFKDCGDIVTRKFTAGNGREVYIAYFDDLSDREMLER